MLQHLVRFRWEEFGPLEHRNFANATFELMSEIADTCEEWALKSQTAALVAEIVRREFLNLWQELLPSLVSLSSKGPVQAELVSMMLRWLPEDITVHNEDLEGDRRRLLLRGLNQSLPEILPLLYTLLERHFGAAVNEVGRQQLDIAKQHAAAVTATLSAVNANAEWAPLSDLSKYGIIHGCGFLLSSPDFQLHVCEFFKLVSPRKRPVDDSASDFGSAMSSIIQILMNLSREFLVRSSPAGGAIDESDYEFVEYVCESMVSLGSSNLQCIVGDSTTFSLYLQRMLGFFQHFKLALHYQSRQFCLVLLRDAISKPKLSVHSSGDGLTATNVDSTLAQVDEEKRDSLSTEILELWSDDFEGNGDFGQYRSMLDLAVMESMQMALENVVISIFDGLNEFAGVVQKFTFEGLLRELLSLNWTEPALVEVLGRYLEAMGPFLKYFPDAVASVINKLFELLNSLPFIVKDPSTSSAGHARLQICTSFIRKAKAADKSILPHMKVTGVSFLSVKK